MEKYMIVLAVLADLIIGKKRTKEYSAMMTTGIAAALGIKLWDESEEPSNKYYSDLRKHFDQYE